MTRAILHLVNDQPLSVELVQIPSPGDIAVICTDVRTIDGKRPVFIDFSNSTFVFPMLGVRFLEILNATPVGESPGARGPGGTTPPAEPEDLEIDEDFLRRVREA